MNQLRLPDRRYIEPRLTLAMAQLRFGGGVHRGRRRERWEGAHAHREVLDSTRRGATMCHGFSISTRARSRTRVSSHAMAETDSSENKATTHDAMSLSFDR